MAQNEEKRFKNALAILQVESVKQKKLGDFNSFVLADGIHKKKKKDFLGEEIRVTALQGLAILKMREQMIFQSISELETIPEYERLLLRQKSLNPE